MELARVRNGGFVEYVSLPTLATVIIGCALAAVIELVLITDWSNGKAAQAARSGSQRSDAGGPACRICGVVESVREVAPASAGQVSTVVGGGPEGVALLLGVLAGNVKFSPPPAYETQVRMNDGSVRATREYRAPDWKSGDPVRLMRGRIEPLPAADTVAGEHAETVASEQVRVERAAPTHALCEAESDGKVLVAWKNGRHYCFRYGSGELLSAATPAG